MQRSFQRCRNVGFQLPIIMVASRFDQRGGATATGRPKGYVGARSSCLLVMLGDPLQKAALFLPRIRLLFMESVNSQSTISIIQTF